MKVPHLSSEEQGRLVDCLRALKHQRKEGDRTYPALGQLRDFIAGDKKLVRAVGLPKFSTLPLLADCLDPTLESDVVAITLSILEGLIYRAPGNIKLFVKKTPGVQNLVALLREHRQRAHESTDSVTILVKCFMLLSMLTSRKEAARTLFLDNGGLQVLGDIAQEHQCDEVLHALCDVLVQVISPMNQGQKETLLISDKRTFQLLVEFMITSIDNDNVFTLWCSEVMILAINAFVSDNDALKQDLMESGLVQKLVTFLPSGTKLPLYPAAVHLLCTMGSGNEGMKESILSLADPDLLPLALYMTVYDLLDEYLHIVRHSHLDDIAVVRALKRLTQVIGRHPIHQYLYLHLYDSMTTLIACLENVDEDITCAACTLLHLVLYDYTEAQVLFLFESGMEPLAACLGDYSIRIKLLALRLISILTCAHRECQEEVLESGVLDQVLHLVSEFSDDGNSDVSIDVVEAAIAVVGHCVSDNVDGQNYLATDERHLPVVNVLRYCVQALTKSQVGSVEVPFPRKVCSLAEITLGALNNVVFHHKELQAILQSAQVHNKYCMTLLQLDPPDAVMAAALNLLINMVDTNPEMQQELGTDATRDLIQRFLHPEDDSPKPRVVSLGCILLSHIVWSHPQNQSIFGSASTVKELLDVLNMAEPANDVSLPPRRSSRLSTDGRLEQRLSQTDLSDPTSNSTVDPDDILNDFRTAAPPIEILHARGLMADTEGEPGTHLDSESLASAETSEARFSALLALINLSYQNTTFQDLFGENGGIATVLTQIESPIYATRKTATFCLGNLTKGNIANSERLISAGGVERLIAVINDEEDDELSYKAFHTLAQLGTVGIARVGDLIEGVSARLKDGGVESTGEGASTIAEELEQLLPVFNGLVYTVPENRAHVLQQPGVLRALLSLLSPAVPIDASAYAAQVFSNTLVTGNSGLHEFARNNAVIPHLSQYIKSCASDPDTEVGQVARIAVYSTLQTLTLGSNSLSEAAAKDKDLMAFVISDSMPPSPVELQEEAGGLLLDICLCEPALPYVSSLPNLRRALESLQSTSDSATAQAKAQSVLRDLK